MRLTSTLWKQHLGRMFKAHWKLQGQRKIRQTRLEEELASCKIQVCSVNDVKDIREESCQDEKAKECSLIVPVLAFDSTHPLYKKGQCYVYRDNTLLIGGLDQAKVLMKAVQVKEGLPKSLEDKIDQLNPSNLHSLVKKCILTSHVFDAEQEKLPRLFDPERPAWNFQRVYGISDKRRNLLICEKLLHLCGIQYNNSPLLAAKDCTCIVPIEKDGDIVQFEVTLDMALLSPSPPNKLTSVEDEAKVDEMAIPDLYPLKHTITLDKMHSCDVRNTHPVNGKNKFSYLHTVIIHYNETEMQNLHETPVLEHQILGRCLVQGFAAAISQARQLFGEQEKEMSCPVVVQCIQTDGRLFDFSVVQLNSLEFSDGTEGMKNVFWMLPRMELFTACNYKDGRPHLEGYNPEVFKNILGFCTV